MKAKEKAKELVDKMYNLQLSIQWNTSNENKEKAAIFNDELGADVELYWHELAKQSALFTVIEIINSQTCCDNFECKHEGSVILRWWGDVKREIELL